MLQKIYFRGMKLRKVFMAMKRLNKGAGSTRVMMNRAKGLIKKGYDVTIVTFKNSNVTKDIKKVKKMGRLDKKLNVLNMYTYYQKKNTRTDMSNQQKEYYQTAVKLDEQGYQVQVNQPERLAHYVENGIYVKCKKWKKDGGLNYIDYFHENNGEMFREKFHESGYVKRKEFYDPVDKSLKYIQYFTRDGFCFLESWFIKHNQVTDHYLFDRDSSKRVHFSSTAMLQAHWLNELCLEQNQQPYVFCDKKEVGPALMNMKQNIAQRIFVIHKNHLRHPFKVGSSKREFEEYVLENLKGIEHVVFLTHKQKQDVIKEFGEHGNMHVIPNSVNKVSREKVKKENKTVSLIARLHPEKQIEQAIDAFQKVIQEIPGAKLEIYGHGEEKETLKQKIKDQHLSQNVFLKGYAENTDLVYKKSIVTLLTSRTEAFAMVIVESMANGTPVISYDVNYGPSDIIRDGTDGYLIRQDKDILAKKIIELLKNPRKARKMGKKARKNVMRNFQEETVIDQWVDLLESSSQ